MAIEEDDRVEDLARTWIDRDAIHYGLFDLPVSGEARAPFGRAITGGCVGAESLTDTLRGRDSPIIAALSPRTSSPAIGRF